MSTYDNQSPQAEKVEVKDIVPFPTMVQEIANFVIENPDNVKNPMGFVGKLISRIQGIHQESGDCKLFSKTFTDEDGYITEVEVSIPSNNESNTQPVITLFQYLREGKDKLDFIGTGDTGLDGDADIILSLTPEGFIRRVSKEEHRFVTMETIPLFLFTDEPIDSISKDEEQSIREEQFQADMQKAQKDYEELIREVYQIITNDV